jgi:SAM-dependent methyltransferase
MDALRWVLRHTPLAPLFHGMAGLGRAVALRLPGRRVRFGSLRRLAPISRQFGYDRGQPIDRYYIEAFLAAHAPDIRGRVLEIADGTYTRRFGGDRVTTRDVLHVEAGSGPEVTIVGDLRDGTGLPEAAFDCVILTQTLQFIYDVPAAIRTVHRILKPGGIVLATVPGISNVSRYDMERWGQYWSFTTKSARLLFEADFPPDGVTVEAHGNVLTATAFLYGLAVTDLRPRELQHHDPDYELVITIRAEKR